MDHTSTEPGRRPDDDGPASATGHAERAERLSGLLRDSAGDPPHAARLDRQALATMGVTGESDPLLSRLEPDDLLAWLRRTAARARAPDAGPAARREVWDLLDLLRRPTLLRRIARGGVAAWSAAFLEGVEASHLCVGPLLRHRAERYGSKILFEHTRDGRRRVVSWRQAASRVEHLARVLLSLEQPGEPLRVALLSGNRIEMALLDLACLSSGVVNVLVPANASESDVGFILAHSGATVVIVSGTEQLGKVLANRTTLERLRHVISIDADGARGGEAVALEALAAQAEGVPRHLPAERGAATRIDDLATLMYTSGTTGTPKGIRFSHRNIVFKRFARALALPEIGERDCFLCFLPLFHTFGRFLEMLGCVFWGARYCFLGGTSTEALVQGLRTHRPTVFISVPKKWIQLHEWIAREAGGDDDQRVRKALRDVTGGRLRWGLSAAGHLDSEIFRLFQSQGVELVSGFGMTEATGGITMTAPGEYRDGSLGTALPGIELRLAEDGELWIRGPYVMMGYLDPAAGEGEFDDDGWFPTGDLMERDSDGHLRLVDRKKEIYKNVRGETIAPQRVENLFRDFASVGRAFLVGDHREYNTLLIYPKPNYNELDFSALGTQEVLDHFRSLVVSVNRFLAPYERIVDFALIDRDLDDTRGELTPKGTPRRKTVEHNFRDTIRQLYHRATLHVDGLELTVPNWLVQILGVTARDLRADETAVVLPGGGTRLTLRRLSKTRAVVGSCEYRHPGGAVDLGGLLTAPRLWLGNHELVGFAALDAATRQRRSRAAEGVEWVRYVGSYEPTQDDLRVVAAAAERGDADLLDLDIAARMLASAEPAHALAAIGMLEKILTHEEGPLSDPARRLLARVAASDSRDVRRRAFRKLLPAERATRTGATMRRFLWNDPELLDAEMRTYLSELNFSKPKLEALIELTRQACLEPAVAERPVPPAAALADFLAAYGAGHPIRYRRLRAFLERMRLLALRPQDRRRASVASQELVQGFRRWLGRTDRIAVDPETGREYGWEEVVVFDEDVTPADRVRLLSAMKDTAFLKEAVFLFSSGASIRLSDIPPGGVWVRLAGSLHGKSVYRISVQTRFQGAYDLAANVNHELDPADVEEEIRWLVLCGDPGNRNPLVEDFGGYWPQQDLWSEEFIAGETLDRALRRLSRSSGDDEDGRFRRIWPFLAWATLAAWVDFWNRSGRRLELADSSMTNVIVPTEDFQSGVRIVSVSRRRPHEGLLRMMQTFRSELLEPAEEQYPALAGQVGWATVFSSVLEIVGEQDGLALFVGALDGDTSGVPAETAAALREFVESVRRRGFVPLRLHFAIERYRRWAALSEDPTSQARARTLQENWNTYGLQQLGAEYPEIRVRFFRETVFQGSPRPLARGLDRIIESIRSGELAVEDLLDAVADLRASRRPGPDEDYFLARLSYPFLRPEDAAVFVRAEQGGKRQSEIVVNLADDDGQPFRVRHALTPKEVERLQRLFLAARLDVHFRMEHRYLLALDERSRLIAGIYYEVEDGGAAHLEKIVVAEAYRRKGVSDRLMLEFFNRLRASGVKTVTTGFFRPEYFYRHGFRIEKRYAGLVKSLEDPGPTVP